MKVRNIKHAGKPNEIILVYYIIKEINFLLDGWEAFPFPIYTLIMRNSPHIGIDTFD